MRPTALGAKAALFLVLVTAAFVASPYSNLFFLLLAFLIVVLALGTLWTWWSLRGVLARVERPRPFAAGTEARVDMEISAGRRPRFAIEVMMRVAGRRRGVRLAHRAVVAPGSPATIAGALPALPRGVHGVEGTWLRSCHPFGLWWRRVAIEGPEELVVHPQPLDADPTTARRDDEARLFAGANRAPDVPAGVREWAPGDSLHAVDWRATARRSRPMVKELERESGRGITVRLDRRCDDESFEAALSRIAGLARRARELDQPIELVTQGCHTTFGDERRPLDDLLRWLAEASALPAGSAPPPPTTPDAIALPQVAGGAA